MSTQNKSTCAACGKGGDDGLKICNGCRMVKYCNAICQMAHRPEHKNECKKRAAELKDEALFKKPPPRGDCDVCFEIMPLVGKGGKYQSCCGKMVCTGCIYRAARGNDDRLAPCPFCRSDDNVSNEVWMGQLLMRIEAGDAYAHYILGQR